ncbi:MAG: TolC family protein, partial [Pseudomonadota bacterium]
PTLLAGEQQCGCGRSQKRVRRMRAITLATFLMAAWLGAAQAQPESPSRAPLLLEEVLSSSAQHYPQILESLAKRRAASGKVLEADGAFDLVFEADAYDRVSGFWSGGVLNTQVRRPLRPLGAEVYGGYRISDGRFPIYEDEYFTNAGGEFKIGALFSLLRDRSIDERRFKTTDARLALQQAELEILLTQVGVQHKAIVAYLRWVWAGRQLAVYEDLLRIARDRQGGLQEQVRSGARARIFLTENLQNISRRERLAMEAQRDFLSAANNLSLYYRDGAGRPLVPDAAQLPPTAILLEAEEIAKIDGDEIPAVLAQRPELQILRTGLERARQRAALSKNELQPRLDLTTEVSRDVGAIAEGGASRDSTDTIVGLRFTLPLQRREARGRLRQAEAEVEAMRQRRRQLEDQIEIELRNIIIDLDASTRLVTIADQEVGQSETMREAERERFESGASDFFLVNVREETAADARIRYYLAALQTRIAQANYHAATLNLNQLGIDPAR